MIQSEERLRGSGRTEPPTDGASTDTPAQPRSLWTPELRRLVTVVGLITALVLLIFGGVGYLYFLDQALYVTSDKAQLNGNLVQVVSQNPGQIRSIAVDLGDHATRNQELATIALPNATQVHLRSPIDGVVIARQGSPGDAVSAGRPILTLVDPTTLWVDAQVEEPSVGRVRAGQSVEVSVESLGQSLRGRVVAVGGATSAVSPGLQPNVSPYSAKVTQLVPVKIDIEYDEQPLLVGGSVTVRIRVHNP